MSFLKKNKHHLFYISSLLTLILVLVLLTKNNEGYTYEYIIKNKISSIIGKDDSAKFRLNSNLPDASITFDTTWANHIIQLNELVKKGDFKTYRKLNKYFKGEISLNGKNHKVKIKVHGKEPDGHIYESNVSLKVKFKDNNNIFKSKKIKLIISQRLVDTYDNMKILSDYFSLFHTVGFWYNIKVNNKPRYAYLVQIPMGNDYIKNYIKDKNIIDFADAPYYFGKPADKSKLNYNIKDEKLITEINHRLLNLDSCIINKSSNVFDYFDQNYITRFAACHLTGGFLGHGFNHENLYILYNKKNKKFYPLITRDNFISPLQKGRNEFEQIKTWEHFSSGTYRRIKNQLFSFIYSNAELRTLVLDYLQEKKEDELKSIISAHKDSLYYPNNTFLDFLKTKETKSHHRISWRHFSSDLIIDNLKTIKNRIKNLSYSSHFHLTNDSITILLSSHSIYPLHVSDLTMNINSEIISSIQIKYLNADNCLVDSIIPPKNNNLSLSSILKEYPLFENSNNSSPLFHTFKIYFHKKVNSFGIPYDKQSVVLKIKSNSNILKENLNYYINQTEFVNI